ncbi:hypothetical protein [Actinomadura macra]|uniref:hypothetical protein n=1 Tax=Actinomadura macra TaxID=46164 RepID=UPI0012F7CD3A|nr:hypothetical protein [Actinomadura macra]
MATRATRLGVALATALERIADGRTGRDIGGRRPELISSGTWAIFVSVLVALVGRVGGAAGGGLV